MAFFTAPMDVSWHSQGVPGGLKLPGERVTIGTSQGVIVDRGTHTVLWWQPRPDPEQPGMFEMALSAGKRIPKEELIRMAASVPIPLVREYPLEVMRAVYEEITKELFDKRNLYDKVSMTGCGSRWISLSFYGKADPEIVDIVKSIIDRKVPGAQLVVEENVTHFRGSTREMPRISQQQAISSAREYIPRIPADLAWTEKARMEAYLRGDLWFVLFWEEGLIENRIRVSVDAVTGVANGASRG